ncbi:MAG: hypothetical protein KA079_02275 [Brachymonas sp.]|nr:hypothetical protein [Brachymonas sp.]
MTCYPPSSIRRVGDKSPTLLNCRLLPSFPRRRESTAAHNQKHGFPPARE